MLRDWDQNLALGLVNVGSLVSRRNCPWFDSQHYETMFWDRDLRLVLSLGKLKEVQGIFAASLKQNSWSLKKTELWIFRSVWWDPRGVGLAGQPSRLALPHPARPAQRTSGYCPLVPTGSRRTHLHVSWSTECPFDFNHFNIGKLKYEISWVTVMAVFIRFDDDYETCP